MKGIVLAGGTATRLYPLTIVTNKHLLPIYDRPMIYYPIETLARMGIREVMVIVGGKSVGDVVELLGDGSAFGIDLTYRYQPGALGIAHAIGLARDFVGDDAFCCVLGDNILRGPALADVAATFESGPFGAGTLLYQVPDPERFGVAELDADGRVVAFEEKPDQPKSDLIPIGVYFLRPDAFDVIAHLLPVGAWRARDHRRPQPLHPQRRPLQPDLRGPLDRRRDRAFAPARSRAGRGRRRGRTPAAAGQPAGGLSHGRDTGPAPPARDRRCRVHRLVLRAGRPRAARRHAHHGPRQADLRRATRRISRRSATTRRWRPGSRSCAATSPIRRWSSRSSRRPMPWSTSPPSRTSIARSSIRRRSWRPA